MSRDVVTVVFCGRTTVLRGRGSVIREACALAGAKTMYIGASMRGYAVDVRRAADVLAALDHVGVTVREGVADE